MVVVGTAATILVAVAILNSAAPPADDAIAATVAPPDPAAGPLADPCSLATVEEAAARLEMPLRASREGDTTCVYHGEAGAAEAPASVRLSIGSAPNGIADLLASRDLTLGAVGASDLVDIEGLGDGAYVTRIDQLTLLKAVCGTTLLVVTIAGPVADGVAVATHLAELAMERL